MNESTAKRVHALWLFDVNDFDRAEEYFRFAIDKMPAVGGRPIAMGRFQMSERGDIAVYEDLLRELNKLLEKQLEAVRDEDLRAEIRKAYKAFERRVTKLRKEHTIPFDVARDEDTIRDALDELFTGKSLASRPTIDELEERKKEADKRLKADIPPGTGDVGKKTDPTGDALICGDGAGERRAPVAQIGHPGGLQQVQLQVLLHHPQLAQ
jgi:PIN like domain